MPDAIESSNLWIETSRGFVCRRALDIEPSKSARYMRASSAIVANSPFQCAMPSDTREHAGPQRCGLSDHDLARNNFAFPWNPQFSFQWESSRFCRSREWVRGAFGV